MRKALAATLVLASVAAIVAGLAAVNAVNYSRPLHWGRGPGGPWLNNTQITTSETGIEGIISDADWGYLVITTSAGEVRVAAPHLWNVQGQTTTFFKLFAQDKLNIGDQIKGTILTVEITRPNGATTRTQILKTLTDLNTGLDAAAILPRHLQTISPNA